MCIKNKGFYSYVIVLIKHAEQLCTIEKCIRNTKVLENFTILNALDVTRRQSLVFCISRITNQLFNVCIRRM